MLKLILPNLSIGCILLLSEQALYDKDLWNYVFVLFMESLWKFVYLQRTWSCQRRPLYRSGYLAVLGYSHQLLTNLKYIFFISKKIRRSPSKCHDDHRPTTPLFYNKIENKVGRIIFCLFVITLGQVRLYKVLGNLVGLRPP